MRFFYRPLSLDGVSPGFSPPQLTMPEDEKDILIDRKPTFLRSWTLPSLSRHKPTEADEAKPQKTPQLRYWLLLRIGCAIVHFTFFFIHLILLVVWARQWEHNITFPLGDASHQASTVITVVLQVFGTMFTTIMVFTMQQLVIRRQLLQSWTITALHDSVNAWSGLGSALAALFQQFWVPAAVFPTLGTAIYLGCIAVLHVTTGALASLQTFNVTTLIDIPTSGLIDYTANPDSLPTLPTLPSTIPFLGVVNTLPDVSTFVGLANGTIYDVVGDNQATGYVEVNATYFNVSCGPLSSSGYTMSYDDTSGRLYFLDPTNQATAVFIRALAMDDLAVTSSLWNENQSLPGLYPSFVISSTRVVDSNGNSPGIQPVTLGENYPTSYISNPTWGFQALTCGLKLDNITVIVDAHNKVIQSASELPIKTFSSFTPVDPTSLSTPENPTLYEFVERNWWALVKQATLYSPGSWDGQYTAPVRDSNTSSGTARYSVTSADQFLMQSLSLWPSYEIPGGVANPNMVIQAHDLENAMSNMFAAMFWAETNLNSGNITVARLQRLSTGQMVTELSRVSSSVVPISVGLAASGILLFIAASQFLLSDEGVLQATEIDDLGVLQVLWLREKHIAFETVTNVEKPTSQNLRMAGMVANDFASILRRTTSATGSGDMESDSKTEQGKH